MNKYTHITIASFVAASQLIFSSQVAAVGNGENLIFDESTIVDAFNNQVNANSVDFTYHACTQITPPTDNDPRMLKETGYFWVSSYQDVDSVVDSQINHFLVNGYHIYARYTFEADQWMGSQPTPSGTRLNYVVDSAEISLYLDPYQDTHLGLNGGCQIVEDGTANDIPLGNGNAVIVGEKSETNGIANGDFEIRFGNWNWSQFSQQFVTPLNPNINLNSLNLMVFNANITRLQGPLVNNHYPEGSGNLFWKQAD